MAQPRPLFFMYATFQTHITNFTTNRYVEKCPSSIWCWDLNSRPLKHESPPITTRPGLLPLIHLTVNAIMKWLFAMTYLGIVLRILFDLVMIMRKCFVYDGGQIKNRNFLVGALTDWWTAPKIIWRKKLSDSFSSENILNERWLQSSSNLIW